MKSGNLQGSVNWYIGYNAAHLTLLRDDPPTASREKIKVPTRMLSGEGGRMMNVEWADRIAGYFEDVSFDIAPEASHFIHFALPRPINREATRFSRALAAVGGPDIILDTASRRRSEFKEKLKN